MNVMKKEIPMEMEILGNIFQNLSFSESRINWEGDAIFLEREGEDGMGGCKRAK